MPDTGTAPLLAIKSKEGELEALINTSGVNGHVRVMVELVGALAPTGRNAKRIVAAGVESALSGNPLWIDTTWLTSGSPFDGPAHRVLEQLDRALEDEIGEMLLDFDGPCLIPVLRAQADHQELHRVHMLLENQHRPVAIRARNTEAEHDLARAIERIATSLRLAPGDLHLVLDEGYTSEVRGHRVAALAHRCDELSGLDLGSITVLAGSTPRKRTNYTTYTRPRAEVLLRDAVQQHCDRDLAYGDYGVVHPVPPDGGGFRSSPNPYIHYTLPGAALSIARKIPNRGRGAPPPGDSEFYFLEVADELVNRPEFAGADFSWGDRVLDSCRTTPITSVGSSTKWIAMATSHHVAHLARRLDDAAA